MLSSEPKSLNNEFRTHSIIYVFITIVFTLMFLRDPAVVNADSFSLLDPFFSQSFEQDEFIPSDSLFYSRKPFTSPWAHRITGGTEVRDLDVKAPPQPNPISLLSDIPEPPAGYELHLLQHPFREAERGLEGERLGDGEGGREGEEAWRKDRSLAQGPVIPPDVPIPPFPPFPPMMPRPKVGAINNINDVCRVCSAFPYDGRCYSMYANDCLQAINLYRFNVLQIADPICSCYTAIANQLIQVCPQISEAISYLGNCDFYCHFGVRCPFLPTVFALLSPHDVVPTSTSSPAPSGSFVVLLNFLLSTTEPSSILYQIVPSPDMSESIQKILVGANIFRGVMGETGALLQNIFAVSSSLSSTLNGFSSSSFDVLNEVTQEPFQFYLQIDTTIGSYRGQLVFTPRLFSLPNSDNVPERCSGTDCTAVVDLALTPFAIYFNFAYGTSIDTPVSSAIFYGKKGGLTGVFNYKLFDVFGPKIASPSTVNGFTPDPDKILELLSAPRDHFILFGTQEKPFGLLRGQFTDRMKVVSLLYSNQVRPPSGATGVGFFEATLGAGAVCYRFTFYNVNRKILFGYIHSGVMGRNGPIVLFETLQYVPNQFQCVEADTDITAEIILNPTAFYISVYDTPISSSGVLRGQINFVPTET